MVNMSESNEIFLTATIFLLFIVIVSIIVFIFLVKQNIELKRLNDFYSQREKDLSEMLEEATNALEQTNNNMIGNNPNGKFNIQITLNRSIIKNVKANNSNE